MAVPDDVSDDVATEASPAYIAELVATMTRALDEKYPETTKINKVTYTEDLTTSSAAPSPWAISPAPTRTPSTSCQTRLRRRSGRSAGKW